MKLFISIIFPFFLIKLTQAQHSNTQLNPKGFNAQLTWANNPIQKYQQDEIIFTTTLKKCNTPSSGMEKDYVLVSIENKSLKTVQISLNQDLYFNGLCRTCSSNEYHRTFFLPAMSKISGSCETHSSEGLKLFYGSPWVSEVLSKFEFTNIQITQK